MNIGTVHRAADKHDDQLGAALRVRFIRPLDEVLFRAVVIECGNPAIQELARAPGFAAPFLEHPMLGGAMLGSGRVLAAAGLIPRFYGMAEAWLIFSRLASKSARIAALRHVRKQLDAYQADPAFQRIEMYIRADEPWCAKYGRLMGMQLEGLLRRRDPFRRDYCLFARVTEET